MSGCQAPPVNAPEPRRLGPPVVFLVAQASRLHVQPGRLHHKTRRTGLSLRCRRLAYWAPNSKFEIAPSGWCYTPSDLLEA
jgi:hypothetical protein